MAQLAQVAPGNVVRLVDFLKPDLVIADVQATSKSAALAEMAQHVAASKEGAGIDPVVLKRVLEERELLASTAIGDGIAIPHGKLDNVPRLIGALGRKIGGIEFDSIDGKPTYLIFLLVAPHGATGTHLKALARLSRLFRDAAFRQRLIDAPDARAMYQTIVEEDAQY